MIKRHFPIITILFLFIGCKSSPTNGTENFTLYPMKVGNSWTYSANVFDSLGNKTKEWSSTEIFIGDTLIDSVKWYYMYPSKSILCAVKNDGIHLKYHGASDKYTLWYKNPSHVNEIYYLLGTDNYPDSMRLKMELEIIDNDNVSYSFYNPFLTEKYYFKNGIGIVKHDLYGYKSDKSLYVGLRYQLIDYSLN